jgi:ubiquinone/menaquinone biosynthesis C-methylase UbiE
LGCGKDIKKGWINLDFVKGKGVNVIWNINKFPWPFKDNEIDLVFASHVLEHVEDLEKTMTEIRRICKNNAKIIIRVPHFSCGVSYRDPTHKRLFSYFTFDYFEKGEYNLPKFKIKDRELNFTRLSLTWLNKIFNPIINLSPSIYERGFCWIFPVAEVLVTLENKK